MSQFRTGPDPLEVPPGQHGHRCAVAWTRSDPWNGLDRPAGTCWRCPECWRWWVAKTWSGSTVQWRPVWPLSPSWWRCRRFAKEMR